MTVKRVMVTGAFSYTGAGAARELTGRGYEVVTLTNRKARHAGSIESHALRFDAGYLEERLGEVDALINTYWVRYAHGGMTYAKAVANSRMLFEAAKHAGVERVVHVSVSNPERGVHLPYYAGKLEVEKTLRRSGVPFNIVRPTLVVGRGDVLVNNIAYFLRRVPVFLVPGMRRYRVQPITMGDVSRIVADAMEGAKGTVVDAAGPDVFAFGDFVRWVGRAMGVKRLVMRSPACVSLRVAGMMGWLLHDVVLTREEYIGLRDELLVSHEAALGRERVADWLVAHGKELGKRYVNDLDRHFGAGREVVVRESAEMARSM